MRHKKWAGSTFINFSKHNMLLSHNLTKLESLENFWFYQIQQSKNLSIGFLRKYKAINFSLDISTIFAMSLRVPAWIKIGMLNNKFWEMWLVSSSCKEHNNSFLQPLSKVVIPLWMVNCFLTSMSKCLQHLVLDTL